NLGTPADFTARATFAKSFFETGGIEAIDGEGLLPSPGSRPGGAGGGGNSAAEQRPAATLRVDPPPQGERVEAADSADAFAALAAAFKASGASLACLCSTDKLYADQAVAAAKTLHAAGAKHIYLAGRPGEREAELRGAGVQDFFFAGSDALAILGETYQRMG